MGGRPVCNIGQGVGDSFTELSKIVFSMDCFIPDFLRLFTEGRRNLALGWVSGCSPSGPSISGILLQFPNSIRSS